MLLVLLVACAPMGSSGVGEGAGEGAPSGAEPGTAPGDETQPTGEALHTGVTRLEPRSGSETTGTVTFRERRLPPQAAADPADAFKAAPSELEVTIELEGAPPGEHAVHVHEFGDCSAPDAASAGGHFSPLGHPHGRPDAAFEQKHPGDLGNVTVGEDGRGRKELTLRSGTLGEGQLSFDGLAVVVHEKPDQFSQPSGDAGGRIACGVIDVDAP